MTDLLALLSQNRTEAPRLHPTARMATFGGLMMDGGELSIPQNEVEIVNLKSSPGTCGCSLRFLRLIPRACGVG